MFKEDSKENKQTIKKGQRLQKSFLIVGSFFVLSIINKIFLCYSPVTNFSITIL